MRGRSPSPASPEAIVPRAPRGVEGTVPGLDAACFVCTIAVPDEIECDDNDACTIDGCAYGTCSHASEPRLCCDPATGARTLIEDDNPCTMDACDAATGQVTHVGLATSAMCVTAIGSRYLGVTPPCGLAGGCDDVTPVGMRLSAEVTAGDVIDVGFIQLDGTLGENPAFATPASWGTLNLNGGFIRPNTTYTVTLVPMGGGTGSSASATTLGYADLDGNGVANLADTQIAVRGFVGDPLFVALVADVEPCVPNHAVNFADVFATVRAFQGETFEVACPVGACCFDPGNPNSCGPAGLFGFGALEAECPPSGVWTEGGVCGANGLCP